MFQFSCRFAFLLTFRILNRTPKITRILTLYQANERGNFDTMTLFSKGDKILHECKGYNARQFIKFLNKGWTKNSINRLRVSSEQSTGVRQRQTPCAYWWKRRHSWVAVAESGRQTSEPLNSQRNFTWGGESIDHQLRRLFTKICVSTAARKGALNSWLKRAACTRYFRHAVWEMITWQQANLHENWNIQTLF